MGAWPLLRCSTIYFACQDFGAVLVGRVGAVPGRPHQRLCAFFKPLVKSIPQQPCSHQTVAADEPLPPPQLDICFPPTVRSRLSPLCGPELDTLDTVALQPQTAAVLPAETPARPFSTVFLSVLLAGRRSPTGLERTTWGRWMPMGRVLVCSSEPVFDFVLGGASRQISQAGGEAAEPARPGGPAGTRSSSHLCRVGPHSSSARV